MMTPEEETRILDAAGLTIEQETRKAYQQVTTGILNGVTPREAIAAVTAGYTQEVGAAVASGLSRLLGATVGTPSVLGMAVGSVTLSGSLYANADEVAGVVTTIVDRHAKGFQQARDLALQLYEGYNFREAGAEPLKISPRNPVLPEYLRTELLTDAGVRGDLARYYAGLQASQLRSPSLRAAYLEALDAIEQGKGADLLAKRLEVAYYEKMRYHANRIAQTELHRAYATRQAAELLADTGVEVAQWRMSPTHPEPDICDYFATVDLYGLGPGMYPKGRAPVAPAHPHCRCYLKPRTDLPLGQKFRYRPAAGRAFITGLPLEDAGRIMGSRSKAEAVMEGADPWDVFNDGIKQNRYRIPTVDGAAEAYQRLTASLGLEALASLAKHPRAIPGAERAAVDMRKLTAYALNPDHPKGGDKARVFISATGFTAETADELATQIRQGLPIVEAVERDATAYGRVFSADIPVNGPTGSGEVRTGWLLENGASAPKLTSVYFKKGKKP